MSNNRFDGWAAFLTGAAVLFAALAALVGVVAYNWSDNDGDNDFNRQVTVQNYIANRGFNPGVAHAVIHVTHVDNGNVRITMNLGDAGNRTVETVVPDGKINWAVGRVASARFVYNTNDVLYSDFKRDPITDRYSPNSGDKRRVNDLFSSYSLGDLIIGKDDPAALVAVTVMLPPKLYQKVVRHGG